MKMYFPMTTVPFNKYLFCVALYLCNTLSHMLLNQENPIIHFFINNKYLTKKSAYLDAKYLNANIFKS